MIFNHSKYQFLLTTEQKEESILSKFYNFYHPNSEIDDESDSTNNNLDDFEELLKEKRKEIDSSYLEKGRIENLLRGFNNAVIGNNESIFQFWKRNKEIRKELYYLFSIVFAVPATQVSVERAFSTLKFIYSDLRERLNSKLLEDILTVKLNNKSCYEIIH